MLSGQAMELLGNVIYQPRPQYLVQLVLAIMVFIYAIGLLTRLTFLKRTVPVVGG
jgi:hypothetical protein